MHILCHLFPRITRADGSRIVTGLGRPAAYLPVEAERAPVVAAPLAEVAVGARVLLRPVLVRDIQQALDPLHAYECHETLFVNTGEKVNGAARDLCG